MSTPPRPPARRAAPPPVPTAAPGAAKAVADAIQALARAARSLLLYDAGNQIVQQHLSDYRARTAAALQRGPVSLAIAPFQILVGGEVVYAEEDREKSLAFRLFRDGVRGLTLSAATPWEELLALLEIIAVRYTAVRQQEEDAVTLLRKAEFKGIAIEYVEGFTPAEELPEPEAEAELERAEHHVPPPTWDTPSGAAPGPGPPAEHRPVPREALAHLHAAETEEAAVELAVATGSDLLEEAARGGWLADDRDLAAFFDDLRDGLLVDGQLAALRRVFDAIAHHGATALRDRLLRALAQPATIDLVVAAVPAHAATPTEDALAFAPLLGGAALVDALAASEPGPRRLLLTELLKAHLPADLEIVLGRISELAPGIVASLVGAIVTRAPERATQLAQKLLGESEPSLRVAGLDLLAQAQGAVSLRKVCELLGDGSADVRVRAAEVLGGRGDERVLDPLTAALERDDLPLAEVEAIGRALAQAAPRRAGELLAEWLHPKKRLLVGLSAQQRARQWAAVAGVGTLPGPEPEKALQDLAERSDGELRVHCMRTLQRRRGRAHGGS